MIALQGYYDRGRLELTGKAPAETAKVLVIFQEAAPQRQEEFNLETAAALLEARSIAHDPGVRRYPDVEEALRELKK